MHDLADLRGGLALEGEADDLSAVRENRSQIMKRAPHRDQHVGVCLTHKYQVTGDGSWGDEEDSIGEVLGCEEGSLMRACWQRSRSRPGENSRTALMEGEIVDLAPMKGETDCLFLAVGDRFAGGSSQLQR